MKNQAREFYLFGKAPQHEEPDAEHHAWQRRSQEWVDQRRHWDRILDRADFSRGTRKFWVG
ncbi:MAG: hypothetical protein P8K76_18490 [Candidatus Binatia bacterium]|nr:hypothetical protein [Candidatus Binatia bacterium]